MRDPVSRRALTASGATRRLGPLSWAAREVTMSTTPTLMPFQPDAMTPAQVAAVSYLDRYTGHTHCRADRRTTETPCAVIGSCTWSARAANQQPRRSASRSAGCSRPAAGTG